MGVVELVRAGTSGSLRLQPREFMESRKDVDAILCREVDPRTNDQGLSVAAE